MNISVEYGIDAQHSAGLTRVLLRRAVSADRAQRTHSKTFLPAELHYQRLGHPQLKCLIPLACGKRLKGKYRDRADLASRRSSFLALKQKEAGSRRKEHEHSQAYKRSAALSRFARWHVIRHVRIEGEFDGLVRYGPFPAPHSRHKFVSAPRHCR